MKDVPYWLDIPYTPRPALDKDIETEVVVVGAGITGVSAAYHAVKAGFKTVLIEKEIVASGSAGRNGGMVVEGMEIDFGEAIREYGVETAKELWMRTVEARKVITSLIQEHSIDCDLETVGSLYVSRSEADDAKIRTEATNRLEHGIPCEIIEKDRQLRRSPFNTALFNPSDCLLHPAKFIRGVAQAAEKSGLTVYEHTPATAFDSQSVTTPQGIIRAEKVVVALESANPNIIGDAKIVRSQAIVTEPLSEEVCAEMDWNIGGMLWTTGEEYISCRRIGRRLFTCKELPIQPTAQETADNRDWQLNKLRAFFPMLAKESLEVSHRWSGLMVNTSNYRPRIRKRDGYFEIFGNAGNGLTNGIMTGKLLAEHYRGSEIPLAYQ